MGSRSRNIDRHEATFQTSIFPLFCLWNKSYMTVKLGSEKDVCACMFPLGSVIDVYDIAYTLLLRKVAILDFH